VGTPAYLRCTTPKGASNCAIGTGARRHASGRQSYAVNAAPAATTIRADSEQTPSAVTWPRGAACRMSASHETEHAGSAEVDGEAEAEAGDEDVEEEDEEEEQEPRG
jgi:hypothetical protein